MNKLAFDNYISSEPSRPSAIYLCENRGICENIIASGRAAVYITRDLTDKAFFSMDEYLAYMEKNRLVKPLSSYTFVPCFRIRKMNEQVYDLADRLYLKASREGWKLFHKKEYLADLCHQPRVEAVLDGYEKRLFGPPDDEVDLGQFHAVSKNGTVTGVIDIEVVHYLIAHFDMFVLNGQLYLYEGGVFRPDPDGTRIKNYMQKLIYKRFIKANTLNHIYSLLVIQEEIQKCQGEVNQYPVTVINFRNGMYDLVNRQLMPHDKEYYSINQIPHDYRPDIVPEKDWAFTGKFLKEASVGEEDVKMLLQYFGYCMTRDTSQQKFMILKGNGGTGKSRVIGLLEYIIGSENICSISLQDLNKRFYATNLYGKLLNSCADISSEAMSSVDIIKKATGEDTLMYEKKGKDPTTFTSYAKLFFSANEIPVNMDEKSNAWYRRLLIFEMNKVPVKKDVNLQKRLCGEAEATIYMAVNAVSELYQAAAGEILATENSIRLTKELNREADSALSFLDDCIVRAPGKKIRRSRFYQEYSRYCEENERAQYKKSIFFKNIAGKGYTVAKTGGEYYVMDVDFLSGDFEPAGAQEKIPFR